MDDNNVQPMDIDTYSISSNDAVRFMDI